jgi:protein SCO1/2
MLKKRLLATFLAAGTFALSVGAEETGHAHHDQHQHAAGGDGDPHAHHRAMLSKPAEPAKSTEVELLDLVLTDQNGADRKFVSDVIGDRIVVMDFIYTSCTTVCPVLSAVFGQVQQKLGDELGNDVVLVSVSVDPVRDTPQRLKAYAAQHQAQPGWIWLTGNKRTMDRVLDGLGAYSPNFEDHPAMVLVGDGRTGEWSRFFGFPNPDRLMEQVNALQAARGQTVKGG